MSLFVVDPEKCKRGGICIEECPRLLIEQRADSPVPTPVAGAESQCTDCGHCVAVCPQGAISLATMPSEACLPVQAALLPSAEQVDHLLRSRRSVRAYKDAQVPREVFAKLLDTARYAPTGSNRQQVGWLVFYGNAEVRHIARLTADWIRHTARSQPKSPVASYEAPLRAADALGKDYVCRGAPHLVIAHTPRGRETDGVIALAYLELAAYAMGLGACWGGFVTSAAKEWPPLRQFLGLPESRGCAGAMMIGYPKYRFRRIPLRNEAQVSWR